MSEELNDIGNLTEKSSTTNSENKCYLCNTNFVQKSSLRRHVREKHSQGKIFSCGQCGIRFSKKFNLKAHQRRAHSKNVAAFKCPHCSCVYATESVLKKHIHDYHQHESETQKQSKATNEKDENDPQNIAESALEELKQLQRYIDNTQNERVTEEHTSPQKATVPTVEFTSIDDGIVEEITIKDLLYPFDKSAEYIVQRIKRANGVFCYICEYCSKEFRKVYGYLRHRRIHTKLRPFICVLCKKSFPTQSQLKRHCSIHVLDEKHGIFKGCYKCPKCLDSFRTITLFDQHLSTHVPQCIINFNCKQCHKSFQTLKSFFRHSHKINDSELKMLRSLLPSPICTFKGDNDVEHVVHQENAKGFPCSICGLELCSSHISLKQHEKRHRNLMKYQCQYCNGYYASKSSLKVHTRIHENQRNLKCSVCKKTYHTNDQLNRHMLCHSSDISYSCTYCEQTFKTAQYCRSHMMTHLKELIRTNEAVVTREENGASLQTLMADTALGKICIAEWPVLRRPKRIKKNDAAKKEKLALPYQCLKCPRRFRYNCWLKKHIVESHGEQRPFKCEICSKSFRKKQILTTHALVHTKDRTKLTCQVCGKQYASNKSLKIHLRLHTQERPFMCNICSKSFRTSGHLRQHRKSNHKEDIV